MTKARVFPDWFDEVNVRSVDHYAGQLLENLRGLVRRPAPRGSGGPRVVLLTPGVYNSADFEHTFLAQQMEIDLVGRRDHFVVENRDYPRTSRRPRARFAPHILAGSPPASAPAPPWWKLPVSCHWKV